jgi:hypothetical protein
MNLNLNMARFDRHMRRNSLACELSFMHFARVCQQEPLIFLLVPLRSDPLVHPHLHLLPLACLPAPGPTAILTMVVIEIASGKKTANVNAKYGIDNARSASVHLWRTLGIKSVSRRSA